MDENADPKAGLAQVALASDFERGDALWLIDAEKLDRLASYGDANQRALVKRSAWSSSVCRCTLQAGAPGSIHKLITRPKEEAEQPIVG
jgi:hypothetical protein